VLPGILFYETQCRSKARFNVSPPGCATSRLPAATLMHYCSYRTFTPYRMTAKISCVVQPTWLVAMATSIEESKKLILHSSSTALLPVLKGRRLVRYILRQLVPQKSLKLRNKSRTYSTELYMFLCEWHLIFSAKLPVTVHPQIIKSQIFIAVIEKRHYKNCTDTI